MLHISLPVHQRIPAGGERHAWDYVIPDLTWPRAWFLDEEALKAVVRSASPYLFVSIVPAHGMLDFLVLCRESDDSAMLPRQRGAIGASSLLTLRDSALVHLRLPALLCSTVDREKHQ